MSAITIAPVLIFISVFSATKYFTSPLPVKLLPDVMIIQDSFVEAAQVQVLFDADTVTLPLPPDVSKLRLVGDIEYVQAVPSCVTVNVCPAIVIVPVRELVLVFSEAV